MTTQEQRVEFHKAVMDFKRACKKAFTHPPSLKGAARILLAESRLIDCHKRQVDEAASEAISTALRNATPHTFEVTGG